MKTKTKAMILAGVFVMTTTLPVTALARRGGAAGTQGIQGETQRKERKEIRTRQQHRRRDGSCVNSSGAVFQGQTQRNANRTRQQQRFRDGSGVVPVE